MGLVDRLEVLGLTLEDVPVGVADLGPRLASGLGVAGVLGVQTVFSRDVVTIDYAAGRIERSKRSRAEGWPMVYLGGAGISVVGRLEGGQEGLFQIDTAVDVPMVTSTYLDVSLALHVPWSVGPAQRREMNGLAGSANGAIRSIAGSRFCASHEKSCIDLPRVNAWAPLAATVARITGIEHVGILGGSAFQGRVVDLDYPALRVRVRPAE
jgi:hypothetical protein